MINNYSTLSPLICNAKKSSFVLSRPMPFTEEDKIIIKHYRQNYGWGSRKIFSRIGNGKPWTRIGIQHLIEKFDKTDCHQRIKGSGRPRSARSKENITKVEGMILSQEDPETEDCSKIGSFKRFSISHDSFRFKAGNVSSCKNVREKRKGKVDEERLHQGKSSFPQSVMVSAGISNLGKTSLYLIERGVKVDSEYYCQSLLSQMIPEMTALSGNGNFIFQQDGARPHTSKYIFGKESTT